MQYAQEEYARAIYGALTRRLAGSVPETSVSITGAGVHWSCTASRGPHSCCVWCFALRDAQYLTYFERSGERVATGRTSSQEGTLSAVAAWLEGRSLQELHDRFPFVDHNKRVLTAIREDVYARIPELSRVAPGEIHQEFSDCFRLVFRADDRSCELSFYGGEEVPSAAFSWDGCELFRVPADDALRLADLLKRWVCDRAMPSAMRSEFPWLDIRGLADYYERGNPVEGEFLASWDRIEDYYREMQLPAVPDILRLIAQMRAKGYDRSLRAGQSLLTLLVSRSRRHGLRDGQRCVAFEFRREGMDVFTDLSNAPEFRVGTVELTPEVERVLRQLEMVAVD